jgi:hypothetical protein
MVRGAGARDSPQPYPTVGSVPLVGTAAVRHRAAGRGVPAQLDPLRAPAARRPHRAGRTGVVLRRDPSDGSRLRIPLLPWPRPLAPRIHRGRFDLFALRIPGQHGLVPDDERRRLGAIGLYVSALQRLGQRSAIGNVPRFRVSQRTSPGADFHRASLHRRVDLALVAGPAGSPHGRAGARNRRTDQRTPNTACVRIRPARPPLGGRA